MAKTQPKPAPEGAVPFQIKGAIRTAAGVFTSGMEAEYLAGKPSAADVARLTGLGVLSGTRPKAAAKAPSAPEGGAPEGGPAPE